MNVHVTKRVVSLVSACLWLLCLPGCGQIVTNGPLTNSSTIKGDPRLLGKWTSKGDDGKVSNITVTQGPCGVLHITDHTGGPSSFYVTTAVTSFHVTIVPTIVYATQIGRNSFMSLSPERKRITVSR